MKCLLFSPFLKTQRGNSITAKRLLSGLTKQGIDAKAYGFCESPISDYAIKADVIHGLHAFYFGKYILPHLSANAAIVLTMTGTDYNYDLYDEARRDTVINTVRRANKIVVFHNQAKNQIINVIPSITEKISVIPPGVLLEEKFESTISLSKDQPSVLIVAGLRKVKNIDFAIDAISEVRKYEKVKLIHVGPGIENSVTENIKKLVDNCSWFTTLGEVEHKHMASIYKQSTVVINTSFSEAIPNSILEAMYLMRPVVVSNIAGNIAVVENNINGLVYNSQQDFIKCILSLVRNDQLARRLGHSAGRFIRKHYSAAQEVASYIRLYYELVKLRGGDIRE